MTLRDEINEVVANSNIDEIKFLRLNQWQWILDELATNFLVNGKTGLARIWMWDSLREPFEKCDVDDGLPYIASLLNFAETYWFIASDECGKYWVLEGTGQAILRTLEESPYFEYYIVNKSMSWLVCENHHGAVFVKGEIRNQRSA
ncbi:hypothetical protein A3762_11270 [Oleiphilus sp. HI0125]|uniref:DUF6756 family protein n=2 Tax=Oleiphilus sp. HI0125 TaxID=1822266 RepID=UPI0007C38CAA|nr:DUF6756 family protein [Oleiphilus sp. HI0125]KZZ56195.1 hypothetical protein A3762_11270 [Oleiphilus sp. HI0125]